MEKSKLSELHKIDVQQLDQANERAIEALRQQYEQQNDSLRKQLQQKSQMNSLAEEISKSSGSINTLVQRLSATHEGDLKKREEDLQARE